ncbi:hypothetical protein [Nocardia sp. XZ_19_385]|uniref:hypothetical protein n=1 Tax=Nocardia sp. XZ_19_385 TaxID=2769488 RepID=UPI00188E2F6F|nr:hypothetical protein [Nocardia sp. XZ_19_385]
MLQFVFLVVMVVALATLVVPLLRRRGASGLGAGQRGVPPESGSVYVTGISPRPLDGTEEFVTITGNLSGPSVSEAVVYGRWVWDVNQWPTVGEFIPVVYPAGKPDRWQPVHPGARSLWG